MRSHALLLLLAGCPARSPSVGPGADAPEPTKAEVPSPAQAPSLGELRAAATAVYQRQDWPAFLSAQRELVAADPDSTVDRYNLACALARNGLRVEALAELRRLL